MKTAVSAFLALILAGCQPEQPVSSQSPPASASTADLQAPPPPPDDSLVLAGIYQLQQQGAVERSVGALQLLDSIYCKSDGYLSEGIDAAAATIWAQQFTLMLRYLEQHPKSCLRQAIIWGVSAEISTSENRLRDLTEFKKMASDSARRAGLSKTEMLFLRKLTAEVNPAMLD